MPKALIVKSLCFLFSRLPLVVIHFAGGVMGLLFYLIPNRVKRTVNTNLKLCFPDMCPVKRTKLTHRVLAESSKTVMEMGAVWHWKKEKMLAKVQQTTGEDTLTQAMAKGNGVILVLPHLGCWEMIGMYCSSRYPMTSLFRPPRIAGLKNFICAARQRFGAKLVPTDVRGVRNLYQSLKNNELVCILPDQDPGRGNGVFAPFFGQPAHTMTLLSRLAGKSKASVIYAYALRLPHGRGYHIHFKAGLDSVHPDCLTQSATMVNKNIESCIHASVEQYLWVYKRFKRTPDGCPSCYQHPR